MLGADVVKVESQRRPDESRLAGPFPGDQPDRERSALYAHLHAQKRSLALDLSTPSGIEILERLLPTCDVLLDDGALGKPTEARARYERFLEQHERLVVAAFTPFGLDGPAADWPATELTSLAASGWLTAPTPEEEPLMPGCPMAAYGGATYGAAGILLALIARRRFGRGQLVEVPANETYLSLLAFPTTRFAYSGDDIFRLGDTFPFAIFPCRDGHLGVSILTQRHWEGLCSLMGREDILAIPRFATGASRAAPEVVDEIMAIIGAWAKDQPAYETFIIAQERRVPLSIVPSPREVLDSAQYADRGYWIEYDDPRLGHLRVPGMPFRASEGTFAPFRAAPVPGADSPGVLAELEISAEARIALGAAGVLQ
jgi:crotonobetainyl-CoA:carnitine CoA-transferase CaiB-like acyl-CoA transferase